MHRAVVREGVSIPGRRSEGRLVAGVCDALAERFDLDVTLVRLAFLLLSLAWGVGVLLYLALWLVMPEDGPSRVRPNEFRGVARRNVEQLADRARHAGNVFGEAWGRRGRQPWPRPLTRRWIGLALVTLGLLVLLASFGAFAWLTAGRALGLAVIVAGVAAVASVRS